MKDEIFKKAQDLKMVTELLHAAIRDFACGDDDEISEDLYKLLVACPVFRSALKNFLVKKLAEYKKEFDEL